MMRLLLRLSAFAFGLGIALPTQAALPFLWEPGSSNNGLYAATLTLLSTELNSLASSSVIVSSVGGTSGLFTNSNTHQVVWARGVLTLGSTAGGISTGGNLACWWLESVDGSTFESATAAPPRAPDVVFPLPAATLSGTNTFLSQGLVRAPALNFKVICQNNSGQTLNATGNTVVLAPEAVQY
jgi:hypothetical protein